MKNLNRWLSLVKFSHTIFALPFALYGFALAYIKYIDNFSWWLLLYMLLCMVLARNIAMAFNRLIDKDIDKLNIRTINRELPQGKIKIKKVIFFILTNSILFVFTTFFINNLAFYLSPVALFVILFYSYTKRFTFLSHYVLGLSLAIVPIASYLVLANKIEVQPLIIGISVLFWVAGFDILYSLQDEKFDKNNNLHSIPQKFGEKKSILISRISHLFAIIFLIIYSILFDVSFFYYVGLLLFSIILFWEHIALKTNDISNFNKKFTLINGLASIIFVFFALFDIFYYYLF